MGAEPSHAAGLARAGVPAVSFAHWREGLHQAGLCPAARAGYSLAIGAHLDYCRRNAQSVSLASARGFMSEAQRRQLARNPQLWKEALNWFFREGRQPSGLRLEGVPGPGQADTGRTAWERRLLERLRLNHYAWRTEQTYREWAWRLSQFLGRRELESATGEELKGFLSQLAVRGRKRAPGGAQSVGWVEGREGRNPKAEIRRPKSEARAEGGRRAEQRRANGILRACGERGSPPA